MCPLRGERARGLAPSAGVARASFLADPATVGWFNSSRQLHTNLRLTRRLIIGLSVMPPDKYLQEVLLLDLYARGVEGRASLSLGACEMELALCAGADETSLKVGPAQLQISPQAFPRLSSLLRTVSPGAYFRYLQKSPFRASSRLSMRSSGSATSPSSLWYLFNANIHPSPGALNRRKGMGNKRISVGRRLFHRCREMKGRRQEGSV